MAVQFMVVHVLHDQCQMVVSVKCMVILALPLENFQNISAKSVFF